jgi:hypothetical protein
MDVATVTTADQSLLRAVRATLAQSDDAFLCVAFVQDAGVRLLEQELRERQRRTVGTRLLVTTTFGTTSPSSLSLARGLGVDVRVLNPGAGRSYHPKIYLGRRGDVTQAVVGSANLTGGLFTNVEVGVALRGTRDDAPLATAWRWAEELWNDRRAEPWSPVGVSEPVEDVLEPGLRGLIAAESGRDPVFLTLGRQRKPNRVAAVTQSAVYVETERSRRAVGGPAEIPAWMFNLAWDRLRTYGTLTNRELLDELRVHRSSAVCAILARLAPVDVRAGAPITLVWRGDGRRGDA